MIKKGQLDYSERNGTILNVDNNAPPQANQMEALKKQVEELTAENKELQKTVDKLEDAMHIIVPGILKLEKFLRRKFPAEPIPVFVPLSEDGEQLPSEQLSPPTQDITSKQERAEKYKQEKIDREIEQKPAKKKLEETEEPSVARKEERKQKSATQEMKVEKVLASDAKLGTRIPDDAEIVNLEGDEFLNFDYRNKLESSTSAPPLTIEVPEVITSAPPGKRKRQNKKTETENLPQSKQVNPDPDIEQLLDDSEEKVKSNILPKTRRTRKRTVR
jgi:hypothetical protein